MIAWLMTNWLESIIGLWLLNGLRKAVMKPRIRIVRLAKANGETFVDTERQQLLPPWLTIKETWQKVRVDYHTDFVRASDGVLLSADRFGPVHLHRQLARLVDIAEAKAKADEAAVKDLDAQIAERDRLDEVIKKAEKRRVN
jgi:hypothetical protein